MIGLMEIEVDRDPNKILVNKELRDEIIEVANEQIELNIKERNVVSGIIDVINRRFKKAIEASKKSKRKYKLDKKVSKKFLKMKIKAEKEKFKQAKKEAKKQYKDELVQYYKPVIAEKNNVESIKEEKNEHNETLQEIKKEINNLQKYKAYIDMKYTSDRDEYIDESLIPKVLRKK